MPHPHDPYVPSEEEKKYIDEQYKKLKDKKKGKKGLAQTPLLGPKEIYDA